VKENVMQAYLVDELGDCLILVGPSLGGDLGCHNGRP